ncbi:MAG: methyltransferase domain-containing protein [Magnetospirillum sp.]
MRAWLLDLLACPHCPDEQPLSLRIDWAMDEEIIDGRLSCPCCGASWPVRDGVPRFVGSDQDYCGNFGFQWQHWKAVQIDRLAGHSLSETRFLADSGWSPDWIKDKLILDCGCGAGRFTDIAAKHGARVVSVDLSQAVNACRETTMVWDGRVQPIQASLFDLPLRRSVFDGLFCMGVIQHTPKPERLMTLLPGWLKPGGRLAYNFYEADFWPKLQPLKYALRLVTPYLPTDWTLALCQGLVATLFPLSRALSGIRKVRIVNHVLPICSSHDKALNREQQYAWTLLDTFDWYGPRHEIRQDHHKVKALLESQGLKQVQASPGLATASAP